MGLHRMYLKSWLALLYLPFFLGVLYCNGEIRDSREDVSRTTAAFEHAQTSVKNAQPNDAAAATPAERGKLATAQADLKAKRTELDAAHAVQDHWKNLAAGLGGDAASMRRRPATPSTRSRTSPTCRPSSPRTRRCTCTRRSPTGSIASTPAPASTSPTGP